MYNYNIKFSDNLISKFASDGIHRRFIDLEADNLSSGWELLAYDIFLNASECFLLNFGYNSAIFTRSNVTVLVVEVNVKLLLRASFNSTILKIWVCWKWKEYESLVYNFTLLCICLSWRYINFNRFKLLIRVRNSRLCILMWDLKWNTSSI